MTDTTTATLEPAGGRAKTMAKTVGLHMLDVWSHSPALAGATWRWVYNPEARADLKAQKLRPSAHQREIEVLNKGAGLRVLIVAAVVVFVAYVGGTILAGSGPLWWPLLLATAYGAGRVALWLPKATQGAEDATEEYTGERAEIRKMLFAKLSKVDRPESITVSELEEVYDGEAGSIGRRCKIGLPPTNTAADVEKLRANLAGVLGTKTDRIDITEGTSPRQAIVFAADRSPSEIPTPAWPLEDATTFDLAKELIPIGVTLDRKPAGLQLFSKDARGDLQGFHLLLTGMSRQGKSTLLQTILAACGLDDRAVLDVTVLGQTTRDFEDIEPALTHLTIDATAEDLHAQLDRAMAHMKSPTGKPYVMAVDEAQFQLGESGDAKARNKMRELLSAGGKAGISVIVSTQEATKANIDPDLARRPQNRISFRQSQPETAQRAMGSGMTADIDPSLFQGGTKGLAAVIGEDGLHGRVKTPLLPAAVVARIAEDHPREKPAQEPEFSTYPTPGGPSLHVVQDPEPEPETILDHLAAVWPTTDAGQPAPNAFLDDLLDRLKYDGWGRPELRKAARAEGLEPREKVRVGDRLSPGFTYPDLMAAMGGSEATRTTRTP